MLYSASLQQFVEALLVRYRTSPQEKQVRLQLGEVDQLVISQAANGRQLRLSRYGVVRFAPHAKDLEIVCFVSEQGNWIPYEFFRPLTGHQVCGEVSAMMPKLTITNPMYQRALVSQCDLWATRLREQGWLDKAVKISTVGMEADGLFLWPVPTVEEPDEDQLEAWMIDDICEASDGCIVEPDGVCPHGHPSWLRRMGLV